MTTTQVIQAVVDSHTAHLFRRRKDSKPLQYDCKPYGIGNKRGWMLLDATSANAALTVYKALSSENQAKVDRLPLTRFVDFAWKQVGEG